MNEAHGAPFRKARGDDWLDEGVLGMEGGSEGGSEGVRCLRILCEGEGGAGRNKSMVANIKHLCNHRLASL